MVSYSEFIHDYTESQFKYKEPLSEEYKVFLNGKEIPVYTCRISKYSFNRVWPGYQRSGAQTDLVSFVNIVSDEKIDLKVVPQFSYEKIMIKPYSKNVVHSDNNGEVEFSLENAGSFVFVADDFHHTLYIFNSKPIEAPEKNSVTHYFGPGVHMPGKIILHDNESVYVDKDALVFGCILAKNAKNLHIFGNGIFDDANEGRLDKNCYEDYTNGNIKFYECENIRVEGVLFRDSAMWCVNVFACDNAVFDDIKVFGQWKYNTDGVDIVNSRNITLKNSFIHSFDDTITIKGIDRYCHINNENILIDNCGLWCDWGHTCEIGVETICREYKNIVFKNCDIIRAGNAALAVNNGDFAEVSDVVFENISVEYNFYDTPTVFQEYEEMEYAPKETTCIAHLIKIMNELWRTAKARKEWNLPEPGENLDKTGLNCGMVSDITIKNIKVYYDERIPKPDGKFNTPVFIKSFRDDIKFCNISISDVSINGEAIDESGIVAEIDVVDNFYFEK